MGVPSGLDDDAALVRGGRGARSCERGDRGEEGKLLHGTLLSEGSALESGRS
jgi:hypothetical protein